MKNLFIKTCLLCKEDRLLARYHSIVSFRYSLDFKYLRLITIEHRSQSFTLTCSNCGSDMVNYHVIQSSVEWRKTRGGRKI